MMLKMFFDDAGTHGPASPVVGVGGLIGTELQWDAFDRAWKALLYEPVPGKPPIKKWSSYDCRWAKGEFQNYGEAERDHATYRFREVIAKSGIFSLANMIDRAAWDDLAPSFSKSIATAEVTALFRAVTRVLPWANNHAEGPDIAIYFDKGREGGDVAQLAKVMTQGANRVPQIVSFTFPEVVKFTPLQGADMIATESFWHAKDVLRHGLDTPFRPHFLAYLKDNFGKGNGEILGRKEIQEALRRERAGERVVTTFRRQP